MKINIAYIVLLVLMLLTSLYSGNSILWSGFLILITIFLVDLVLFLLSKGKITVEQRYSKSVVQRDEYIIIKFNIIANYFSGFVSSCVGVYKKEGKIVKVKSKAKNEYLLKASSVGNHYFGLEYIVVKSFFGIFKRKEYIPNSKKQTITVIPVQKTLNIELLPVELYKDMGQQIINSKGEEEFSGIRQYISGDSLKTINFKKSSVLKKVMVNEFISCQASLKVNIFVAKYLKNDYTIISECVLAIYNYYFQSGIALFTLNFFNGFSKEYLDYSNKDFSIALANAKYSSTPVVDFNYPKDFNAIVLSQYEENFSLDFINSLNSGSVIFLLKDATEYKPKIQNKLADSLNRMKDIALLGEQDLILLKERTNSEDETI